MNKRANAVLSKASEFFRYYATFFKESSKGEKEYTRLSQQLAALMLIDEAPRRKAEKNEKASCD